MYKFLLNFLLFGIFLSLSASKKDLRKPWAQGLVNGVLVYLVSEKINPAHIHEQEDRIQRVGIDPESFKFLLNKAEKKEYQKEIEMRRICPWYLWRFIKKS